MTDSPDYRLYLESKFRETNTHVKDQFENVIDKLEAIKVQTTKTNGRVSDLEDDVSDLKDKLALHPIECSKAKDIESLKDDLIEYKIIKKYPRATALLIAFFVIALLISAYGTFSTISSNIKAKETRRTIDTINANTR